MLLPALILRLDYKFKQKNLDRPVFSCSLSRPLIKTTPPGLPDVGAYNAATESIDSTEKFAVTIPLSLSFLFFSFPFSLA